MVPNWRFGESEGLPDEPGPSSACARAIDSGTAIKNPSRTRTSFPIENIIGDFLSAAGPNAPNLEESWSLWGEAIEGTKRAWADVGSERVRRPYVILSPRHEAEVRDVADALVIDEAQDILTTPNLDALHEMLRGGLDNSRWCVFLDSQDQASVSLPRNRKALWSLLPEKHREFFEQITESGETKRGPTVHHNTDRCGYHRPADDHPDTLAVRSAAKDFFLGRPVDVIKGQAADPGPYEFNFDFAVVLDAKNGLIFGFVWNLQD